MAHYVAKVLHQRPNDVLDDWGVAELIVAFGQYGNEESYKNFMEWKSLSVKDKKTVDKPDEYRVMFYTPEDLME